MGNSYAWKVRKVLPSEITLALPPLLAVLFFFFLPYGASFSKAFLGGVSLWENSSLLRITLFTLRQAFFSVLVSLAIGLPGAWFIGSGRSPLLRTVTAVPFAMPSILTVLGFVLFYGNSGWLRSFVGLFGFESPQILYKPGAIILAHGFLNFPLVIRLVGDGLERARKAYAPAAASLGASPLACVFKVILPLSFPSIMSASLLIFLYSFTSFAIVLVLGGGPASTTLSVEIYRHARVFLNYSNAGALALVETLIAVSIFLLYILSGKKSAKIRVDTQDRVPDEKKASPVLLFITTVYFLFLAVFVLGPIVSIIAESFLYRPSRSATQVLGIIWWRNLGDTCLPALVRSLVLAVFSASLSCILAIPAAASVKLSEEKIDKHGKNITANLVRFFATAPVVSSGIVLGFGWFIMYGGRRSLIALVMLHALIALPFAFNSIFEGFRSLPANILNAAMVSGASPFRSFLTTALPLSLPRIRSAWGFAAALSLGELNAVMMLGMGGWETLPLYIYRAAGAYRYGTACAAGTLLIASCAAGLLLSEWGRKKHGA